MKNITDAQIKDIAGELDCGMICYIHRKTLEIIIIPDFDNMYGDTDGWEEDLEKIEGNEDDYLRIEKPDGRDSFEIMESFVDNLPDSVTAKKYLYIAINNKKPFAGFRNIIDSEGDMREQWFAHKEKCMMEYVRECIEADETNEND
jgi:Uncharacterised protein family (UPF0158)